MSYTITISADSVAELAGRLLAMGSQLASPASVAAPNVSPAARATLLDEPVIVPYVEQATDEVLYVSQDADLAAQSDETEIVFEPKIEVKPAPADEPEPKLDYVKDVAPLVLQIVDEVNRAAAEKLLADFKVARASHLDKSQYAAFVKAARKILGA